MKISKHIHSCLFVEEQEKTFLIDPGIFTYQEKALDLRKVNNLDYIFITHDHPDHMHLPMVKEIVTKFPDITIITPQSLVTNLQQEGIKAKSAEDDIVKVTPAPHEKLWDKEPPENVVITVFDKLTSPGDSHHFEESAEVLALPIVAPWGSTTNAVNLALRLKPKVIIPIHDWMWKDDFRQMMYQRLKAFFQTKGIDFKSLETGEIAEI